MITHEDIKNSLTRLKPELVRHYGISDIDIFGSWVRGEQRPESDLDIYVDYPEIPSLLRIVDLELFLSEHLGQKVDIVPRECIRPALKKYIEPEVIKV